MSLLAVSTVDLARGQFATTSIYHFLFVPLTLGLGPLVAIMQTLWYRTGDEAWLRLTRFFGTLLLINIAIGVATGLVQEFEFGMNWSVYSRFVGNVFGAPLAVEGLAAFFLESTSWASGSSAGTGSRPAFTWRRSGSSVLGTWLSGYFILVANSWMQHPVGYKIVNGEAQLTSIWALLSNGFALRAYVHTMLAGLIFGSIVMLGICCWQFLRGRDVELFRKAAKLALIVAVPVDAAPADRRQPLRRGGHERAEHEDRRLRGAVEHLPAVRLLALPDRRVLRAGRNAELLDHDPAAPLLHGDRLVRRRGRRASTSSRRRSSASTAAATTCRTSR